MRSDRFKQIQHSKTSKVDEMLIKRYATKMSRREDAGLEPVPKKIKPSKNPLKTDDLEDL